MADRMLEFYKLEREFTVANGRVRFWIGAEFGTIMSMFIAMLFGMTIWWLLGAWAIETVIAAIYQHKTDIIIAKMKDFNGGAKWENFEI